MLRVVTWNVLAQELLQYFWRSSYGLPLLSPSSSLPPGAPNTYASLTAIRMTNVVNILRDLKPDILLLQETSDTVHSCLGNRTVARFIADELSLTIAGESFKGSCFEFSEPPFEQSRGSRMDSGVATLYNTRKVDHLAILARAESEGRCELFRSGFGSPFTADSFRIKQSTITTTTTTILSPSDGRVNIEKISGSASGGGGGGGGGGNSVGTVTIVNIHVRMQFPNIKAPLADVFERLARAGVGVGESGWKRTIVAGDLNAGGISSAPDLAAVQPSGLIDVFSGAPPADDRVLVGTAVRVRKALVANNVPLLAMGTGAGMSGSQWSKAETKYTINLSNKVLLETKTMSSDHLPLIIDIDLEE